jgi:hypothetical protein
VIGEDQTMKMSARKIRSDTIDLAGRTDFGEWTVIGPSGVRGKQRRRYWRCRCSCGVERDVSGITLRQMRTMSCGHSTQGEQHGASKTPDYDYWSKLKRAGSDAMPPEWHSFTRYLGDVGPRPSPKHVLRRHDQALPHGPENSFWTDSYHLRSSKPAKTLMFRGETLTVRQLAARIGVSPQAIRQRISKGWSPKDVSSPRK